MKAWLSPARTAGILYLQFTLFSAAVLWLTLGDSSWKSIREEWPKIPGAVEVLTAMAVLTAASAALGTWLTVRARVNVVALVAGAIAAAVAAWWTVLAAAFLIAPLGFMLFAYKRAHGSGAAKRER